MLGFVWVLVRDWLPRAALLQAALTGLLAMLVGGTLVVTTTNDDFYRLDPAWLHVVMFLALIFLAGAATLPLDRYLNALPRGTAAGLVYAVLVAFGGMIAAPVIFVSFMEGEAEAGIDPPVQIVVFLVLLASVSAAGWSHYFATAPSHRLNASLHSVALITIAGLALSGAIELAEELNVLL
jgi:hypothetical protein